MKIIVNQNSVLLPTNRFDYSAHIDGDEPDDDGRMLVGWGKTQREAVEELFNALDEAFDEKAAREAQRLFDEAEKAEIEKSEKETHEAVRYLKNADGYNPWPNGKRPRI
ncbi:MAG: hypothetical protein EBR82_52540 [Caulobacteraceae bacterium]|nr:hypothetical protein [Caulobacteraceae bacterium]